MSKQHRILIVEDSPTMRQLLVFALRRLKDADLVEARDGMDGLRKVTSDHFDLALIDINMPVMDGLKLIRLIRAEEDLARMPIVVVTTEAAQEDRGGAGGPWARARAGRQRVPDQADRDPSPAGGGARAAQARVSPRRGARGAAPL